MLRNTFFISLVVFAATAHGDVPDTQPALPTSWPAFHGGGGLVGVAAPLPGGPAMKLRWTYVTSEDDTAGVEGGAAIVDGTVYVADSKTALHAIDLKSGKAKWIYKCKTGFLTTPLVALDKSRRANVVYIGDQEGIFHAVNASDGAKLWTVESSSTIHASANVADDRVIFANDGAEIICVAMADGKELWKQTSGDRVNAAPAIAGRVALLSGCDSFLRGYSVIDGKEKFAFDMGVLSGASPAVVGDRIFIGTDQGRIICLSSDGKTEHWRHEITGGPMVLGSAAVADGVVVVGADDRKIYALNASDGKVLWTFKTKGEVESSPAISAGRVYVGSKDKRLYVLDLKSGEKLWDFQAGRQIIASPAIGEGVVVVGDLAGSVYCLEPQ